MQAEVHRFFHAATGTITYLVFDPLTKDAAIVDPVLDFDLKSGHIDTASAQFLIAAVQEHGLTVRWILETHAHADHLSAGAFLREALDAPIGIGAGIVDVQQTFKAVFNFGDDFVADGSQFDHLFNDQESFWLGALPARAIATPGHTSDGMTYMIGDAAFIGDTLFASDVGTARCDFPGGDAKTLYQSLQIILSLPKSTRLFICHDYPPVGREPVMQMSILEARQNVHLQDNNESDFIKLREARDHELDAPTLLLPALQVNIRAGLLPDPEGNGVRYLKIPITN